MGVFADGGHRKACSLWRMVTGYLRFALWFIWPKCAILGGAITRGGYVHLLATDAHDVGRRPPDLGRGRDLAAKWVGDEEAERLVSGRPRGVILNEPTTSPSMAGPLGCQSQDVPASFGAAKSEHRGGGVAAALRHAARRLWKFREW